MNAEMPPSGDGPNGESERDQMALSVGETIIGALSSDSEGPLRPQFYVVPLDFGSVPNVDGGGNVQFKITSISGSTDCFLSDEALTMWPSNRSHTASSIASEENDNVRRA